MCGFKDFFNVTRESKELKDHHMRVSRIDQGKLAMSIILWPQRCTIGALRESMPYCQTTIHPRVIANKVDTMRAPRSSLWA